MNVLNDNHYFARITWNSHGWRRPSGEPGSLEHGSYASEHGYGHEDWLFRDEWLIDGWRYAFIEARNLKAKDRSLQPITLTLFAIDPKKNRRLIATIHEVEILSEIQAKEALKLFRKQGWLETMRGEIRAIGGDAESLRNPKPEHVLNIRYRRSDLTPYPENTFLPDDVWTRNRSRYKLYTFNPDNRKQLEHGIRLRQPAKSDPVARQMFRRGTNPTEYTPEHKIMQAKLLKELRQQFGSKAVTHEEDFVDVIVDTGKERIFYEIKTDLSPLAVIRQALGQILEYAYHPACRGREPNLLVIVGRKALSNPEMKYLEKLKNDFGLPLSYRSLYI